MSCSMPQSLSQLYVHTVFSTKNRERFLSDDIRNELHAYIGGIIHRLGGVLLAAGSVEDHIHLFISHPRTCAPAELVKQIKSASSSWIKNKGQELNNFHWQTGYGIFSISPTHQDALRAYIANQREHHRVISFQEEYKKLLEKNGVNYDEKYLWD